MIIDKRFIFVFVMLFMIVAILITSVKAVPTDVATTFANDTTGFTQIDNVVYWYTNPLCGGVSTARPVEIGRRRSSGGDIRILFQRNDPRPVGVCNPYQILSNLAVDTTYLYWLDSTGLQSILLTANADDPANQLFALPNSGGQLVDGGNLLYLQIGGAIHAYNKTTGAMTIVYKSPPAASNLQYDGDYLYFLANNDLQRLDPANGHAQIHLLDDVETYHTPGRKTVCGDNNLQWVTSYAGVSSYNYLAYANNPFDHLLFGDFDGDFKTDVFSAIPLGNDSWQWVYSAGGVANYQNLTSASTLPTDLRIGDFDGDERSDVFTAVDIGGGVYQWVYSSGGTTAYTNLAQSTVPLSDLRFGDFDGDGRTDVFTLLPRPAGGWQWAYSAGGASSFINLNFSDSPLDTLGLADLDNDGRTDVFNAADLGNGRYQWRFSSAGLTSYMNLRQEPYAASDVRFGNFVGDAKADIFVMEQRPDGLWQWKVSNGGSSALQNLAFAQHTLEEVRFGDFNGDGLTDLFATLPRDFCRVIRPVFYAYSDDSIIAISQGIGGRVRWHDTESGQNGMLASSVRELFDGSNTAVAEFSFYDDVTSAGSYLFFAEKHQHYCTNPVGCWVTPTRTTLRRTTLTPDVYKGITGIGADELWVDERNYNTPFDVLDIDFANDQQFIFWRNYRDILRLPLNAAALPRINLRVTGLEVTQGIQSTTNSIRLIRGKQTFVRVFVQADGPTVNDVTAQLRVFRDGVQIATLVPERRVAVQQTPDRHNVNHHFLFELPWDAVTGSNLRVEAVINPGGYPLEPINGSTDNILTSPTFTLYPSPQLNVIFAEFNYESGGVLQQPQGTNKNAVWINNAYPLGRSLVNGAWQSGLNWSHWTITDNFISNRIPWNNATCANQQQQVCRAYYTCDPNTGVMTRDDRNLCASDYVNGQLHAMRARMGIAAETVLYGEIRDMGGVGQFPRGQAGIGRTASGPDAVSWDGFYAGHEIGHTVGLGHPVRADGQCGLDGNDPVPFNLDAKIGPANDTVNGFARTGSLTEANRPWGVLRGIQWYDLMGYCNNANWPGQWISDQNYERLYSNLNGSGKSEMGLQMGDWLAIFGSLDSAGESAALTVVERWQTAVVPPITTGDYRIRLRDAAEGLLTEIQFQPEIGSDNNRLSFGVILPFVEGTRSIEVARNDGVVLAQQTVSAHPPMISNVVVTESGDQAVIRWTASDSDGDALRFDLLISHDNGTTFRPLTLNVSGNTTQLDLTQTGGGNVIMQVIASDGVQTAVANSLPTTLTVQPPVIVNFTPDCTETVNWQKVVNFSADVVDPQDGMLPASSLAWYLNGTLAGYGAIALQTELLAGYNNVVLTAINSAGVETSEICNLYVADDLGIPAAELAVSPTQVEWLTASDAPDVYTATINLSNVGGGLLTWTASSNASWLQYLRQNDVNRAIV